MACLAHFRAHIGWYSFYARTRRQFWICLHRFSLALCDDVLLPRLFSWRSLYFNGSWDDTLVSAHDSISCFGSVSDL
jgi:hypothetical protein